MSYVGHIGATDEDWLQDLLACGAAAQGRVIFRSAAEVEKHIGRKELERVVRSLGFRMMQAGDQVMIVCRRVPMRILV